MKVTEAVRQKLETATRLPEVVAPEAVAGHWALRASLNRQLVVRKERKGSKGDQPVTVRMAGSELGSLRTLGAYAARQRCNQRSLVMAPCGKRAGAQSRNNTPTRVVSGHVRSFISVKLS